MASQKYILHVTAGPSRDRTASAHQTVPVNTEEPVLVETESMEARIWVRIRGYRGLPRNSPETAPYFEHPKHRDDRYSIQFNFRLKEGNVNGNCKEEKKNENEKQADEQRKPSTPVPDGAGTKEKDSGNETKFGDGDDVGGIRSGDGKDNSSSSSDGNPIEESITGDDILLGNDFDHPIRDKLPPGFSTAFRIVKWFIDPGLDGDVDADEPYLYGPLLSSINTLEFGDVAGSTNGEDETKKKVEKKEIDSGDSKTNEEQVRVLEEDGSEDDSTLREKLHIPKDSKARMKYFLNADRRKEFVYEKGREYRCDFYNPYLDFNDFALRLPGFTLNIMSYWDGQPLRYVLKNRSSDEVYFVVTFDLLPIDENGELLSPISTIDRIGVSNDNLIDKQSGPREKSSAEPIGTVTSAAATASSSSSGYPIDDQDLD